MRNKDEMMKSVISKMLVLKPDTDSHGTAVQFFINLYPHEHTVLVNYGISEMTANNHVLYVDSNAPIKSPDVQEWQERIKSELLAFAELGYHQIMITLRPNVQMDNAYDANVSYYTNIFTDERNDPEAELLFWRSQLGFKANNDEEQTKINKVAKYFKD